MKQLINKYNVEPEYMHLEVTETAYTENPKHIIEVVKQLRFMGFKIEMDDFGSGYSSLNMLSELPIDVLKLDMHFIQQKMFGTRKSILSFVIALSKWLELDTVAEGVETREQMAILKTMGCKYIQGYYFAKPMPLIEFEKYMSQHKRNTNVSEFVLNEENEISVFKQSKTNTIMIVEDVEMNREILKGMLEDTYNLIEAKNGKEACDYLNKKGYEISLIILDLIMPVMDGFQVLDVLRSSEEFKKIPVIITSEVGHDSELRALRLGAENFVAKPYEKEILLHHVKSAIDSAELKEIKNNLEKQGELLKKEAYHDLLTGCYNRRGLLEVIQHLSMNQKHAIYMLDIDNLKICNDTYGHAKGDYLIQEVAHVLKNETRDGDIISRIGGDEFIVVIKNINDDATALKKGILFSNRIKEIINIDDEFIPSCSIGCCIMDLNESFDSVYKKVDSILYEVKKHNKGNCLLWRNEDE